MVGGDSEGFPLGSAGVVSCDSITKDRPFSVVVAVVPSDVFLTTGKYWEFFTVICCC